MHLAPSESGSFPGHIQCPSRYERGDHSVFSTARPGGCGSDAGNERAATPSCGGGGAIGSVQLDQQPFKQVSLASKVKLNLFAFFSRWTIRLHLLCTGLF